MSDPVPVSVCGSGDETPPVPDQVRRVTVKDKDGDDVGMLLRWTLEAWFWADCGAYVDLEDNL